MIQHSTTMFISKDLIKNSLATHSLTNDYHELIRRNHESD